MDIFSLSLGVAALAVILYLGGGGASSTQAAFAAYFRGHQPDPWPHGVQEEYWEERWGSHTAEASTDAALIGASSSRDPFATVAARPPDIVELPAGIPLDQLGSVRRIATQRR